MQHDTIGELSLEQKVGQLFFIGITGTSLDDRTRDLLSGIEPGGVCMFSRNIKDVQETRELLDEIRQGRAIEPFLSLDQEGGLVDRLRRIVEPMPAASEIATEESALRFGTLVGEVIRTLGFNMDFAPVVDVVGPDRVHFSNGLRSRTFGRDENDVVTLAGAFISGLRENGILSCLKHFPGLGAAEVDSHEKLPVVTISDTDLREIDLQPYRRLISLEKADSIMIAHAAYPNVQLNSASEGPASLSPQFINGLLRDELGFDGVVISDDLEMGAIINEHGIGDACVAAVKAGTDMLAICAGEENIRKGYSDVLSAVHSGAISESRIDGSVARILALKARIVQPLPFDASRLKALSGEIVELKHSLKKFAEENNS